VRSRNSLSASIGLTCLAFMFALFFASLFTTPTMGQSLIAGDIAGRVTDPTGAVVPNAIVNLKSLDTGTENTATSSSEGSFDGGNR
jgi:Carboxypeptidase regulatory-like domain